MPPADSEADDPPLGRPACLHPSRGDHAKDSTRPKALPRCPAISLLPPYLAVPPAGEPNPLFGQRRIVLPRQAKILLFTPPAGSRLFSLAGASGYRNLVQRRVGSRSQRARRALPAGGEERWPRSAIDGQGNPPASQGQKLPRHVPSGQAETRPRKMCSRRRTQTKEVKARKRHCVLGAQRIAP